MRKSIRGFTPASAVAVALALLLVLLIQLAYASTTSTQSNSIATQNSVMVQSNLITNFTAIGLPQGAVWNISYDNASIESNSITATFSTPPGTYGFSASPYHWKTGNGTVDIYSTQSNGSAVAGEDYIIYFNASINFTERGLPNGATWVVTFAGQTKLANTSSSMVFNTQCIYCNTTYLIDPRSYNGTIYVPQTFSGNVTANNISLVFSKQSISTTTSTTVGSTSVSSVPSSSTVPTTSTIQIGSQVINPNLSIPSRQMLSLKSKVLLMKSAAAYADRSTSGFASAYNISISGSGGVETEQVIGASSPYNQSAIGLVNASIIIDNAKGYTGINVNFVRAGILSPLMINDSASAFSTLYVETDQNFTGVNLNVSYRATNFSGTHEFAKSAYKYVHIQSSISDAYVNMAEYEFWVNKSWILKEGIAPEQVALYKYVNGTWVHLPTSIIESNSTAYKYVAHSSSFSNYVISYSTGSVAGDLNPEKLILPAGYSLYLCGAAANYTLAHRGTVVTWTADVTATSPSSATYPESSIGYQTSNVCKAYTTGAPDPGLAMVGIGLNETHYSVYTAAGNSASSASLTYTVAKSGSFTAIIIVGGYYAISTISIPSGCSVKQFINNTDGFESAVLATCNNQTAGSYSASDTLAAAGGTAIAAYVFSPLTVTFDDVPTTGTISTSGQTYSSGSTANLIGTGAITANPPSNFKFSHWVVSNTNITLQSLISQSTGITVNGNGIVTAYYNGTTRFHESGLPVIPVLPTSIIQYVNITLNNTQSVATPAPFQQLLDVNSIAYSSYEASNLQNVEFFYPNGTVIPSWLESGDSNTAANTIYWLNISGGIPANTKFRIFMGFATTSTNLFNKISTGEAPQLSATYGEYDDGAQVFDFYSQGNVSQYSIVNGGKLSLINQTTPYSQNAPVLSLTGSGSTATSQETVAWLNKPYVGNNVIIEGWINISANDNALFAARGSSATTDTNYLLGSGWSGGQAVITYESGSTNTVLGTSGTRSTGWHWVSTYLSGSALNASVYSSQPYLGGTLLAATTATSTQISPSDSYLGIAVGAGQTSQAYFYQWRARAYPPNGVMPGATFGSAVSSSSGVLRWNVTYDGVLNSSLTPNITYYGAYGSYAFTIPNQTLDGRTYVPSIVSGTTAVGNVVDVIFTEVGVLSATIEQKTTTYDSSDLITASAPSSSDTVEILINGSVAATGTGIAKCNVQTNCTSSKLPLAAGKYNVTAYDSTLSKYSGPQILTVNRATPVLSLSVPSSYEYNGTGGTVSFGISSVLDQLLEKLYVNGIYAANTLTTGTYKTASDVGTYTEIVNTTGDYNYTNASLTKSFSILPKLYSVAYVSNSASSTATSMSVSTTSGYSTYLCTGASGNGAITFSSGTSDLVQTYSYIGHQTTATCTESGSADLTEAIIGIKPITGYTLYDIGAAQTATLTYTVLRPDSFVAILVSGGYYGFSATPTVPANCTQLQDITGGDTFESSYIAVCQVQQPGSYTVSGSLAASGGIVLGAYVFPSSKVTFDDVPIGGTVSTNGQTYSDGQSANIIGTGTITANPPSGYTFSHWVASGSNLTVQNANADTTNLTVIGNGTVTAHYNGTTTFNESGLPSGFTWNVIYNGVTKSSTTKTITFSNAPGSYAFTVPNQTVSGNKYAPTPNSGTASVGNTTSIAFALVGELTITLASNTTSYDSPDIVTATAPSSSDTVEILINGSVAATGTGIAKCNVQTNCTSSKLPLAAGKYNVTAYAPSLSKYSTPAILTVNKAAPVLSLSVPPNFIYDGNGGTVSYSISTVSNQLLANLYVNGVDTASTNTLGTYVTSASVGSYSEVFNTTGNANYTATSKSAAFSITTAPYIVTFSTGSASDTTVPTTVTLPANYALYLCGSGVNYTISSDSWTTDSEASATTGGTLNVVASIGHQTSDVCSVSPGSGGGITGSAAIAGIGLNLTDYSVTSITGKNTASASLTYSVPTSGAFVVLMIASGSEAISSVSLPSGCVVQQFKNNTAATESAYIATCQNVTAGGYSVSADLKASGGVTLTEYTFGPYDVNFQTDPTNATIITDQKTFSSGQSAYLIGVGSIDAVAPNSRFQFANWTASNSVNTTFSSLTTNPANVLVRGAGTITANFNGITSFTETGLPSGTKWNVTFDNIFNQSTSQTITFFTRPGTYLFGTPDIVLNGSTYLPNVSSGSVVVGDVQDIKFTKTSICTISLNSSSISFGSTLPDNSISTMYGIRDSNNGSTAATVLLSGTDWNMSASVLFGVSNTSYSASYGTAYSAAGHLLRNTTATTISVGSKASSPIYFGLNVPIGQTSGSYRQEIYIENSC
jgi:PGF-pre-PGF domain-containing protein